MPESIPQVQIPESYASFLERLNPEEPGRVRCTHKEAEGLFEAKQLSARDLSTLEATQALILQGAISDKAVALARWIAWAHVAWEVKPKGFDPHKIKSERLLHALYLEAKAQHEFFREAPVEGAFSATAEDAF